MAGGWTYRGLLYIVNNSDGSCGASLAARGTSPPSCPANPNQNANDAITTNGGFGVWGVVAVDGNACLKLGSNGVQVSYDSCDLRRRRVLRNRRPRAEHLARARPEGRLLKARRSRCRSCEHVQVTPPPGQDRRRSRARSEPPRRRRGPRQRQHHRSSKGAVAQLRPGILRDGEVADAPALSDELRTLFAEHDLGTRVRLGVANQRIVVRTLDLPLARRRRRRSRRPCAPARRTTSRCRWTRPCSTSSRSARSTRPPARARASSIVAVRRDMIDRLVAAAQRRRPDASRASTSPPSPWCARCAPPAPSTPCSTSTSPA